MKVNEKMIETLKRIVAAPSISGTEAENFASNKIYEVLSEIQYFKENKEHLKLIKIENDVYKRSFVSAFFHSKKPTKNTVIINGHLDVVGVNDFGALKDIAFDCDEYTKRIKEFDLDEETSKDLESGNWIFGRGTADMKYGIALGIELIRELSTKEDFVGNILLLAVPGEESNSEGMLATIPYIEELQNKGNYDFKGFLVTECAIPKWQGDETKRVYIGTVGKVMPTFFCVGSESHVCEPLYGLNPNLMLSELNTLLEVNVDFCDTYKGSYNPPPICLKQTDLKELYNVQTPIYGASYYNLITLRMSNKKLIKKVKDIAYKAFENSLKHIKKNYNKYKKISGNDAMEIQIEPLVITFEELYKNAKDEKGEAFEMHINKKIEEWTNEKKNIQEIAIGIMKETYENSSYKKPMIILGFAPPYYPDKFLDKKTKKKRDLITSLDRTISFAKEKYDVTLEKDNFYDAICDLSYTGLENPEGIYDISKNMPGIDKTYTLPVDSLKKLNIPGIVFGGFGKDFHKYTERISIPYSFDVVPELYEYLIQDLLMNKKK